MKAATGWKPWNQTSLARCSPARFPPRRLSGSRGCWSFRLVGFQKDVRAGRFGADHAVVLGRLRGREGEHLLGVAVDQKPFEEMLDEIYDRQSGCEIADDEPAAGVEAVVKVGVGGEDDGVTQIIVEAGAVDEVEFRLGVLAAQQVLDGVANKLDGSPAVVEALDLVDLAGGVTERLLVEIEEAEIG